MNDVTVFANLTIEWDDYCWRGDFSFWSGGELEIQTVDEQKELPDVRQEIAWVEFVNQQDFMRSVLLTSVFEYYIDMRPKYLAAGGEWAEGMPDIESASDIEKMITIQSIIISSVDQDEGVRIGLLFSCDWDSEHGLGVVVKDVAIEKIGGADCAILM